ncbi:MAG TPA: hypothetical protein VEO96_08035 [Thermoplasmata archaeon]|nr:hypothetical protein [Thermoplasmata archaeon]
MPLPEFTELARPQALEPGFDPETIRLGGDAGRIRQPEQGVDHLLASSGIRGFDAVGPRKL